MIEVLATREGLKGQKTASGYVVESNMPFVALPSVAALRLWISIHNPKTNQRAIALVLDVGPWNETDHAYVFQPATLPGNAHDKICENVRPQAESGVDLKGRKTNGAGIDLSDAVWNALGMIDNGIVTWEFI